MPFQIAGQRGCHGIIRQHLSSLTTRRLQLSTLWIEYCGQANRLARIVDFRADKSRGSASYRIAEF